MLVCQLYGTKARTVNEARHELFCRGGLQERNLPPNKDALLMHVKRANYQTKIWRSAYQQWSTVPLLLEMAG